VVCYNVKFAEDIKGTIALFHEHPAMRHADLVLLQEMDVPGVRKIAHALRMHYVYYPATINPQTDRPFGNAILARWPIEDDRKILLPHLGRFGHTSASRSRERSGSATAGCACTPRTSPPGWRARARGSATRRSRSPTTPIRPPREWTFSSRETSTASGSRARSRRRATAG
jgi:hypothetical protein